MGIETRAYFICDGIVLIVVHSPSCPEINKKKTDEMDINTSQFRRFEFVFV